MKRYKIRVHDVAAIGAMAKRCKDYFLESNEALEAFAKRLSTRGFLDATKTRWIMPASIMSIEQK